MQFQEEIAQLEALKKQTLQKLITSGSQYINIWTECQETSQQVQLICDRQRQRTLEGFSPGNHPNNRPGFHSMNEKAQFEERQRFERQSFEHKNDEQAIHALNQQLTQSRIRATDRWNMIKEFHSVLATLSKVVNEISHPQVLQMDEELSNK